MTTTNLIEIDDPRIAELLKVWHENGRAYFEHRSASARSSN